MIVITPEEGKPIISHERFDLTPPLETLMSKTPMQQSSQGQREVLLILETHVPGIGKGRNYYRIQKSHQGAWLGLVR
jgi:hypothetical protein